MKRPAYDSPSLPITWDRVEYVEGQNEYIPIHTEMKAFIDSYFKQANELAAQGDTTILSLVHSIFGENPYELKEIINRWMLGKNDQLKELLKKTGKDIQLPLIPTDSIVMKVDKEAVRRSGMKIPEALGDSIPEYMTITLRDANGNPKRALYKSELMMLEMLAIKRTSASSKLALYTKFSPAMASWLSFRLRYQIMYSSDLLASSSMILLAFSFCPSW